MALRLGGGRVRICEVYVLKDTEKNITFNFPWSGFCSDLSGSCPK